MATGTLGKVYDQVLQAQTDAQASINDATDLQGYAVDTYPNDETLQNKVNALLADANTVMSDISPLTTDQALPPNPGGPDPAKK